MAVLSPLGGQDVYEARYISFRQKVVLGLEVVCPVRAFPSIHVWIERQQLSLQPHADPGPLGHREPVGATGNSKVQFFLYLGRVTAV